MSASISIKITTELPANMYTKVLPLVAKTIGFDHPALNALQLVNVDGAIKTSFDIAIPEDLITRLIPKE